MTIESSTALPAAPTRLRAPLRLNNIAELRLFFAASVVLSHSVALLGGEGHKFLRTILNSEAAVQGFFILSGYLVFGSFDRLRAPLAFYTRRILRIYPAYCIAVLLFLALGIGQTLALGHDVAWSELPLYLAANLTTLNFIKPDVTGIFADNPLAAINGALWSIKVELMFYASVPLLYFVAKRSSFAAISAVLILLGTAWWPALEWAAASSGVAVPLAFKFQLPGQIHYFALGIALFARSRGEISTEMAIGLTAWAILLLLVFGATREAVHALVLVALIGGLSRLPQAKDLFGHQDLSYGIYLCHFPIIQLLIAAGVATMLPLPVYMMLVGGLAMGYGLLSWNFIERPALALRLRRSQ